MVSAADIRHRRQMIARRRRKLPPAAQDEGGIWLGNTFVPWAELEYSCTAVMDPMNSRIVEEELGKMHYTKDPTYNLRRPKRG